MQTREEAMTRYALRFNLNAPDAEPTDENLRRVLASCALPPRAEWCGAIRELVERGREDDYSMASPIRAEKVCGWGRAAVKAGAPDYGSNDDGETDVSDMLANVMHYCEADGIDFEAALARAEWHYNAEREGVY